MDNLGVPLFLETPISTTNGGCSIAVLDYQSAINSVEYVELFPSNTVVVPFLGALLSKPPSLKPPNYIQFLCICIYIVYLQIVDICESNM